jgi:hypothetical protein
MNLQIQAIKELNINISEELEDFLESGCYDIGEFANQEADNSSEVIYYARAEKLYSEASLSAREGAEEIIEDIGGFPAGCDMSQRFCILAFWILYRRISEDLVEQCSELSELLTNALDIPSNRRKWGEIVEDMIESLDAA